MLGIAANAIVNAPHIKEYASGLFERGANILRAAKSLGFYAALSKGGVG